MKKNIFLVACFFLVTPLVIATSAFSLLAIASPTKPAQEVLAAETSSYFSDFGVQVYASLPQEAPSVAGSAQIADARAELVRQYLERYNSPLVPHADKLVAEADKHGLDFRLTTAIAQQESNLCKKIPPGSFNCWGWGIHSQGTLHFDSFEEGIETVTAGLRREYIDKGYTNVDEIMTKYTPLSNGSWAEGVSAFMLQME